MKSFRRKVAVFRSTKLVFDCLLDESNLPLDPSSLSNGRSVGHPVFLPFVQWTSSFGCPVSRVQLDGVALDPRVATTRTLACQSLEGFDCVVVARRKSGPGWPLACRGWCRRNLLHDVGMGRRREGRRGRGVGRARRDGDASSDGVRRMRSLRRPNLAPEKKSLKWTSCRRASRSTLSLQCWRS